MNIDVLNFEYFMRWENLNCLYEIKFKLPWYIDLMRSFWSVYNVGLITANEFVIAWIAANFCKERAENVNVL